LWSKFLSDVQPNGQSKVNVESEKKVEEKNKNCVELVADSKKKIIFSDNNIVTTSKAETVSPKVEPQDSKK
jgi:hypothetical protein